MQQHPPGHVSGTRGPDFDALHAALREQEAFDPSASAGLFVGVRTFLDQDGNPSPSLLEIPFAVDDAIDLAWLFVFELKLLVPTQVTLLLSGSAQKQETRERRQALLDAGAKEGPATLTSVLPRLTATRRRAGSSGLLVMSFATHGFAAEGDKLLLADSSLADLELTSLPLSRVLEDVASAEAPRRLVFIDACRERVVAARSVGDQNSHTSQVLASAIAQARGMAILSATTSGGFSYDDPERCNGVFTARVLEGLRGAAPADARGFITAQSLASWLDEAVRRWIIDHRPEAEETRAGISFQLEDLRSGQMPLAVPCAGGQVAMQKQSASERVQGMLGQGLLTPEDAAGIQAALSTRGDPVVAPLVRRLDAFSPGDEAAFVAWWQDEGPAILSAIAYHPAGLPPVAELPRNKPAAQDDRRSRAGEEAPANPPDSARPTAPLEENALKPLPPKPVPLPPKQEPPRGQQVEEAKPPVPVSPQPPSLLARLMLPGMLLGSVLVGLSLWKYKETDSLVQQGGPVGGKRSESPELASQVQQGNPKQQEHASGDRSVEQTGPSQDAKNSGQEVAATPTPSVSPLGARVSGVEAGAVPSASQSLLDQAQLARMTTVLEKSRAVLEVHRNAGYTQKTPPEMLAEAVRELNTSNSLLGNVENSRLKGEEASSLRAQAITLREDARRLLSSLKRLQLEQQAASKGDALSKQVRGVYEAGKAAAAKGDVAGATRAFSEVARLDPRNATLYSRLASEQLQLLGVQTGAIQELKPERQATVP